MINNWEYLSEYKKYKPKILKLIDKIMGKGLAQTFVNKGQGLKKIFAYIIKPNMDWVLQMAPMLCSWH